MQKNHIGKLAPNHVRQAIQKVAVGPDRGRDLTRDEARAVMQSVLSGEVDEVQTAVFLIALRMKRESIDEFVGIFDALQSSIETVIAPVPNLICLADPFDGYLRHVSMTPFVPSVLAACGFSSVLHGVVTVGPKSGVTAQQVYQRAGILVNQSSQEVATSLSELGWGYLDQAQYAPALSALIDLRDRMVKRTALTTLERLLMPIKGTQSTHMALGYVHKAYPSIYAGIAQHAGYDSILLTKGVEGGLAPALNKPIRRFFCSNDISKNTDDCKEVLENEMFDSAKYAALRTQDCDVDPVQNCLDTGLAVLSGEPGVARNSLCLAAGQILMTYDPSFTLIKAVEKVGLCLDNGAALEVFDKKRSAVNK